MYTIKLFFLTAQGEQYQKLIIQIRYIIKRKENSYICIFFSINLKKNKYQNRIELLREDEGDKCKEIDQLELFSLISDQNVYRNTVNSLSSLYDSDYYKDKNILQSCKSIYNK